MLVMMLSLCSGVVELETGVGTLPRIRLEDSSSADNIWHIVRHDSVVATASGVSRSSKVISEIFLTRLLSTKVANQSSLYSDCREQIFILWHMK